MEHKINSYTRSREIFERATKVIPSGIYGHQGPAEGCFIPVDAFPFYAERAKGSYFWDVDECEAKKKSLLIKLGVAAGTVAATAVALAGIGAAKKRGKK